MSVAFPGESAEYRAARDRLLEQELELRRATEAVVAARRELPPGGFMFPSRDPGEDRPGPASGQTAQLQLGDGPCPLDRLLTFAEARGWRRLRLVSSAANTFNHGVQRPMLNVFRRDGETIRHVWGSELFDAPTEPGQDPRHVGTLEPVWNLFDLTPAGRPGRLGRAAELSDLGRRRDLSGGPVAGGAQTRQQRERRAASGDGTRDLGSQALVLGGADAVGHHLIGDAS